MKRNSAGGDLKIVQLFDALDKMEEYDEGLLLKKHRSIQKRQLSNLKAHLYKQLLNSLRLLKDESNIDMTLHEQMDHARILYNKGLYLQSLKILDKVKELAKENNQLTYMQQVLFFEKKVRCSLFFGHFSQLILLGQGSRNVDVGVVLKWLITKRNVDAIRLKTMTFDGSQTEWRQHSSWTILSR